jgi:hypothetical protein
MWTVDTTPEFCVTDDQIDYLAAILDLQTWPVVLDLGPAHDRADAREAAHATAAQELSRAGVLCNDTYAPAGVDETLAGSLAVLANPDAVIEIRRYGVAGTMRVCVARSGPRHVLARRTHGRITVRLLALTEAAELGALVTGELGSEPAANVSSLSAPAAELGERLDRASTAADYVDAFYALGAPHPDAARYAAAFETCVGHCEIIALEMGPGMRSRTAGAVAVYDTARGRIVASPTMSPDGRVWTTLSAGTPHRIARAVALLMETLPTGRWMP